MNNRQTLVVEGLTFEYPTGGRALDGVSFSLDDGEKVALLGPNGAGKSTLLVHLNGIMTGQGVIVVAGKTLNKANLGEIRPKVGLVFQNPDDQLFCSSVEEDVAFGPRCMGRKGTDLSQDVAHALSAVGMEALKHRFPQQLSGGEKKRAALATVLSMQPILLALDEPTAGLDARARRSVIEVLKALPQAMLVATHDLSLAAEIFQRAIVLDAGQIVYDGALADILSDDEFLKRHGLLA